MKKKFRTIFQDFFKIWWHKYFRIIFSDFLPLAIRKFEYFSTSRHIYSLHPQVLINLNFLKQQNKNRLTNSPRRITPINGNSSYKPLNSGCSSIISWIFSLKSWKGTVTFMPKRPARNCGGMKRTVTQVNMSIIWLSLSLWSVSALLTIFS